MLIEYSQHTVRVLHLNDIVHMYTHRYIYIYAYIRMYSYTVEPLDYGHFGTLISVLITEVSSIQRSLHTVQYYTGTQNGVLIIEVSAIQRFVIERFHCMYNMHTYICVHMYTDMCMSVHTVHTHISMHSTHTTHLSTVVGDEFHQ